MVTGQALVTSERDPEPDLHVVPLTSLAKLLCATHTKGNVSRCLPAVQFQCPASAGGPEFTRKEATS